jgi:hypothetical protein
VTGSCEYGDEYSGSGVTDLLLQLRIVIVRQCFLSFVLLY